MYTSSKMKAFPDIFKAAALAALCAASAACNTPDKERFSRAVAIETIPAGAEVAVNGLSVGKAPLTVFVATNEDGYFVRKTTFTALASTDNLFTKTAAFQAYVRGSASNNKAPSKIIFDTTKNPTADGGVETQD